jgi:uncharacterized membrane protein
MDGMHWYREAGADVAAVVASVLVIAAYYAFLRIKVRANPLYTVHGVNELARTLWVRSVMAGQSRDVMAVQTLRNFVMGASLMASTAALLIVGTLTLSGQAEAVARNWHVMSVYGSVSPQLWIAKVLALLADFIVAFFAFAMAVRLANHVAFMINVGTADVPPALSPEAVARRLNRAGNHFATGLRAFFFAVPLVFWLFGPAFLVLATLGLVAALHRLDRSPA